MAERHRHGKDYPTWKTSWVTCCFQVILLQPDRAGVAVLFDLIPVAGQSGCVKLIQCHPHVFPEGTLASRIDPHNRPDEDWIKQQLGTHQGRKNELDLKACA